MNSWNIKKFNSLSIYDIFKIATSVWEKSTPHENYTYRRTAEKWKNNQSSVAETISHRTGVGQNELIGGWHALLSDLLNSMRSYLMPAQIITFQHLSPQEKQQFQHIFNRVHVPDSACGVYLPSSVRNQLMYSNQGLGWKHPIPCLFMTAGI